MDLDQWLKERTFHHSQFHKLGELVDLKEAQGLKISLCFPALNEAKTIGKEIRIIKRNLMDRYPLLDEIGVVDSGSTDRTRETTLRQGALFFPADECLPELKPLKGKGENLWKSLHLFNGDIIVWVDSDIRNIHPKFVYGLVGPLLMNPQVGYVKAFYRRPIRIGGRTLPGGGRVTELLVRPFLNLLYPDLSMLAQPLSGEYAGRRSLLERIPFFSGYGVEIGLLIDIEQRFGIQAIAQVDMDERIHRNQAIESLRRMSFAILSVLISRSEQLGKLALLEGLGPQIHLVRKHGGAYLHDTEEVHGKERPPMITVPAYQKKWGILEDDRALIQGLHANSWKTINITGFMQEPLINLDIAARSRDVALVEMVEMLRTRNISQDPQAVANLFKTRQELPAGRATAGDVIRRVGNLLKTRERKMTTGLGAGIAIPHAITSEVTEPVILIGRSQQGIDFLAIDRKPVHLIFVILAPETDRSRYLEILSSLAGILKHKKVVKKLLDAGTPSEALSILKKYETIIRLSTELERKTGPMK
jgi:glucosyl-3-phosphoglycerate synthase